MTNIDKVFPNKFFTKTSIDNLITKGQSIDAFYKKTPGPDPIYDNFNKQYTLFLSKLPNSTLKNITSHVFNRGFVFMAVPASKVETGLNCRIICDNNYVYGYLLLSPQLGIDVSSGDVQNIDEAIYATYQGIIRSAILLFSNEIKKDKDLHKLLSTYFYLVVLKALGKENLYSEKQKNFLHIICLYAYYRCFTQERAPAVKSIIKKHFADQKLIEYFDEFEPRFKDIEKYSDIKDLPKMFIDSKLIIEPPNTITLNLIKSLKLSGYYSLIGPLDMLVSMAILSKYPTDLYTRYSLANDKMQDAIETIISKYMNKIKFKQSKILDSR